MSQWSAIALIQKVGPMVMQSLSLHQMAKWCPIILAFPFLNEGSDHAVKEVVLRLAYQKTPHAILDVAKVLIGKEIERGETVGTATELNAVWDEQIADLLLQYAKKSDINPKSLRSLLSILFSHNNTDAYSFALSLIPIPPPANEPERSLAIAAATALMLDTKDVAWSIVWPAIQSDEDFGKQVVLGINHDYEAIGRRLNEDQLADLYIWLTRHFHPLTDSAGKADVVSPLDRVEMWRNAIIQLLIHRGTFRACEAVNRLQRELPGQDWLKWVLVDAQTETRRTTWDPSRAQDIIKLAEDHKLHLVQSGDQLLQVLTKSLERLQAKLQGARPSAPYLWDNASKLDAEPKDENMFSDYVANFLEDDLKQKGIVLNREVRIHRGQRTDIQVDAITQTAPEQPYDSITVIIECKGCWNTELHNAMRDQLINRYLRDNHCQHGLYLVGWFNCDAWSKRDSRRKHAERLCPKIDSTRQMLATSAADLSNGSTRVKSVVLDASLH